MRRRACNGGDARTLTSAVSTPSSTKSTTASASHCRWSTPAAAARTFDPGWSRPRNPQRPRWLAHRDLSDRHPHRNRRSLGMACQRHPRNRHCRPTTRPRRHRTALPCLPRTAPHRRRRPTPGQRRHRALEVTTYRYLHLGHRPAVMASWHSETHPGVIRRNFHSRPSIRHCYIANIPAPTCGGLES